jgi:sigma-B regulation protein RsbU (phosphoserine phosphatase)
MEPGDTLLLYTDGITEAANHQGTLWGEDRLADIIRQNVDLSAEQLIQTILKSLREYTDGTPFVDDVTLVLTKVT